MQQAGAGLGAGWGDDAFQDRSIEVSESAEEPVVGKRSRVTEEVRVGKQASERQETVHGKVRQTEVNVEKSGAGASYRGPERRKRQSAYSGAERRMAAR